MTPKKKHPFWIFAAFVMLLVRAGFCLALFLHALLCLVTHDWREAAISGLGAVSICPVWDDML